MIITHRRAHIEASDFIFQLLCVYVWNTCGIHAEYGFLLPSQYLAMRIFYANIDTFQQNVVQIML